MLDVSLISVSCECHQLPTAELKAVLSRTGHGTQVVIFQERGLGRKMEKVYLLADSNIFQ